MLVAVKTRETEQITFRLPSDWVRRAERLAAESDASRTRTSVLRDAIILGLSAIESSRQKRSPRR